MSHYGFTVQCLVCNETLVTIDEGLPPPDMIAALARTHDASSHNGPRKEAAYRALAAAVIAMETDDDATD